MIKLLELFAGSRSVGKVAEQLGMQVLSVDWTAYENIDIVIDIGNLATKDIPFIPDIIWASPDCTTYSVLALKHHREFTRPKSEYAAKCDHINWHLKSLISEWLLINPNLLFYIENPRGMMRKMRFVRTYYRKEVWYCTYGDFRAKPTDIFTNNVYWKPRKQCFNNNENCHHEKSPRLEKNKGTSGMKNSYERSKIPYELIHEILTNSISIISQIQSRND